ncbi:hypothetical protein HZC27_04980 [Candidatus Roizmanbacteria bacterium]|nr:hypothetical protein [Candidatus Roizmanbacteria bacterium]
MNTVLNLLFSFTPLKFYVQSIWRDEAFSYLLAKQNILQILSLTAKDFNPPLYYLLLHVWMGMFGSSEIAMRTLSFFFFLGTLYVVGMFLMDIFEFSIGEILLFLLLFVLNPLLHYYAFEARMYSLFAFLITLSFYFLAKKSYRKYALTVIFSLYTHYFAIFPLFGQIIYFMLTDRKNMVQHIKMFIKIGFYFLPWIIFVILSKPPFGQSFWIPPLRLDTVLNTLGLLFTGYEDMLGFTYSSISIISLTIFCIIAFSFFILRNKKLHETNYKNVCLMLLCWVAVPTISILLISFFKPMFLPRYMIFITVGLLISLTYLIHRFPGKLKYPLLFILMIFSLHYGMYQTIMRNKGDVKTPLLQMRNLLKKDDVVYVTHEYNFHPAEYYINDQQVFLYGKTYEEVPSFVGKVLIPKDKIKNSLPLYPKRAFVFKDDLSYSIQALY